MLYKFLKISTKIWAKVVVNPSIFLGSSFIFTKIEKAIFSPTSVCHFLPWVPIPAVWNLAITIVPFFIVFSSILKP